MFVSTYVVNPITTDLVFNAIKGKRADLNKFVIQKFGLEQMYDDGTANYIASNLYASILRFTQNNKSYRYSFAKDNNLNSEEKKTLNLVLKNINLEGAYFLNPAYLTKVELKFYNFKNKEKLLFDRYIKYVIKKELENFVYNKSLTFGNNEYLTNRIISTNETLTEYYKYISLVSVKLNSWYIYGFDFDQIKKVQAEIRLLIFTINEFYSNKALENSDLGKFKEKVASVNDWVSRNRHRFIVPVYRGISDQIMSPQQINDFFAVWEYNIKNLEIKDEFNFSENNFDLDKLNKSILQNYDFKERKFNLKEFISINIFSIIFAFVVFSILRNFIKK